MYFLTYPESFYLAERSTLPCIFWLTRKDSTSRKDQFCHALSDLSGKFSPRGKINIAMYFLTYPGSFCLAESSISPCIFWPRRKVSTSRKDQHCHAYSDLSGKFSHRGKINIAMYFLTYPERTRFKAVKEGKLHHTKCPRCQSVDSWEHCMKCYGLFIQEGKGKSKWLQSIEEGMRIITTDTPANYQASEIPHVMRLQMWPKVQSVANEDGRNERMGNGTEKHEVQG